MLKPAPDWNHLAEVFNAESKSIWDGYEPKADPSPPARDAQVPEPAPDPGYVAYSAQTLTALEARRAARRADIAKAAAAAADQRGA